jgi:DNA-binding NarL/FixJ family response regulator
MIAVKLIGIEEQRQALFTSTTSGPKKRERDARATVRAAAGPRPVRCQEEAGRSNNGRSHELALLDGSALYRRPGPAEKSPAVRVLLAESAGLIRAGLRSLLEREDDIHVESVAASGEEAVSLASELRPDVVLMGIRLAGIGGLAATRRIVADPRLRQVRVVILTANECEEDLYGALRSGASGFMPLDTDPVELIRAVRVVAAGGAQLSPWAARRVLEAFASTHEPKRSQPGAFEELTMRERHVVSLAARGLTNGEIAQRLVVSPATVKTHVSRAMLKLHARDRAKLVALAYQTGFVELRRALEATGPPNDSSPPLPN